MSGPRDPAAAGRDRLWAGYSDRERVIEALRGAFVPGRPESRDDRARVTAKGWPGA